MQLWLLLASVFLAVQSSHDFLLQGFGGLQTPSVLIISPSSSWCSEVVCNPKEAHSGDLWHYSSHTGQAPFCRGFWENMGNWDVPFLVSILSIAFF